MKKIFTFFAAIVCAMSLSAASFGIRVNGTDFHEGTQNSTPADPSFTEYMVLGLSVSNGATLQLWDPNANNGAGAGWAVDLDGASVGTIVRDGDHYNCTADGCYDFYIKIKLNQDQLYIGACNGGNPGGGDTPGGGGQGSGKYDYYLKGYRGPTTGNIETPTMEEFFEGGILADYAFEGDGSGLGYFFILVCEEGQVIGKEYMAQAFSTETHCTLYDKESAGCFEKFGVHAPSATFYLYDNGDGTLELSTEQLPGKTLVGGTQGIDNTPAVSNKARKTIIDGRLVIIRGDKMFDATGKQL